MSSVISENATDTSCIGCGKRNSSELGVVDVEGTASR